MCYVLVSCGSSGNQSSTAIPLACMCAQVSGHPSIAPHMVKFYGIRNGIDQDIWDPLEDAFLPRCAPGINPEPLLPHGVCLNVKD